MSHEMLTTLACLTQNHPSIKAIRDYVLERSSSDHALHETLRNLLGSSSPTQVGLIICERLVNMPVQVIPPMYRMLTDEIKWAIDDVRSCGVVALPAYPQCDMHRTNHIRSAISCSFRGCTASRLRK
jgi:hypothetical protein